MICNLVVPQPLPSEIAAGYAGRTARLNGYESVAGLYDHLKASAAERKTTSTASTTIGLLAEMCGMSCEAFTVAHTLMPSNRAVASYLSDVPHGAEGTNAIMRRSAARSVARIWRSCPTCVREDLGFHGHAYWRRDHQLVGIVYCAKHGSRLTVVNDRAAAFHAPTGVEGEVGGAQAEFDPASRKVLDRFADISYALCDRCKPFNVRVVVAALSEKARELMFRRTPPGRDPKLSDFALALMPRQWLAEVFGHLAPGPRGHTSIAALDVALYGGTASVQAAYALDLALMFESGDAALTRILEIERRGVPGGKQATKRGKQYWNEPRAEELYVRCHGSHSAVARALRIDRRTALASLTTRGLPNLKYGDHSKKYALGFAQFVEGRGSLEEICASLALEPLELQAMLRSAAKPSLKLVKRILAQPVSNGGEKVPTPTALARSPRLKCEIESPIGSGAGRP